MQVRPEGLYCVPGRFYVDPVRPVERALITHGHADHARPGHRAVASSVETLDIMKVRYGDATEQSRQTLKMGEEVSIGDARVTLFPAGHVLGSAQVRIEYGGARIVVSGDYKRAQDPTCLPFEPVPCDVFITEATFALPIFRHPNIQTEVEKLLKSISLFPDRSHVIGAYALGKAQRLIAVLRAAGWDRPIFLHGALQKLCDLYTDHRVDLGELRPATVEQKGATQDSFRGEIVLAPPSAIADRWGRRLPDPVVCMASGWMRVRQRAKQRNVELPLIISDHADWDELLMTIDDVGAPEVWITHGQEDALMHAASQKGVRARALALVGFDEEGQ